jgi:hypothetical protein
MTVAATVRLGIVRPSRGRAEAGAVILGAPVFGPIRQMRPNWPALSFQCRFGGMPSEQKNQTTPPAAVARMARRDAAKAMGAILAPAGTEKPHYLQKRIRGFL